MHAACRVRRRSGFTLIEVIVVLAIIAILAALGVQRQISMRQRALQTAMVSDLRNLALAQESWAAEHGGRYAPALDSLREFRRGAGIDITFSSVAPRRWSATARPARGAGQCTLSVDADAGGGNQAQAECSGPGAPTTRIAK